MGSQRDTNIPIATAVGSLAEHALPLYGNTIQNAHLFEDVARKIANEEVSLQLDSFNKKNITNIRSEIKSYQSILENDLFYKINSKIEDKVTTISLNVVQNYLKVDFKKEIKYEINLAFKDLLHDNVMIKSHIDNHTAYVSELIAKTRNEIKSEFQIIAENTANEMAKADKFGLIYNAIQNETQKYIIQESKNVRLSLLSDFNEDLRSAQNQRNCLLQDLEKTHIQLQQSLKEQKKYQYVAMSGCIMGFAGLGAAFCCLMNPRF
jgi:hypothetical protein